jgi:hypothetical protein
MMIMFVNPGGRAEGGAERSLAELIAGLTQRGHECKVVLLAPGEASQAFAAAGAEVIAVIHKDLSGAGRHIGPAAFGAGAVRSVPFRSVPFRSVPFRSVPTILDVTPPAPPT